MVDRVNDVVQRIEEAVNMDETPMNAVAQVMEADMSKLNVTYNGANGDLPDPVHRDSSDADVKRWVTEAIRTGGVPGIPADPNADLTDFVIDRFAATDARPFSVIFVRPKTPFGYRRRRP